MVLNSESNNPTPPSNSTTPTNSPTPSSLSQTMVTSAPFYLNPQISTFSHNLTATPNSFRWTGNHPNFFSNSVGMNPIQHVGSSSNQIENLTRPILQLGLGPYPSLSETRLNHANTINSLLQLGSNLTCEQTKNNSFLQLGSSSILNRGINSNSNRLENRGINLDLNHKLGIDPVEPVSETNKKEVSLVMGLGSSPNLIENRGINPRLNRVQKNETSGFKFRSLALDPIKPVSEAKKSKISLVLDQSSSLNRVENRGNNSDSMQFEKILELCSLALDPIEPISEKDVVDKNPNQLDLIQKGKSKVSVGSPMKAKGSGEKNDAGEGDREDKLGTECSDEESKTQLVKTWNLRPRKPRVNPEKQGNNGSGGGGRPRESATPTRASKPRSAAKNRPQPKVVRPMMEKRELVISLTKEEIEHDFILMTGEKPPKKSNRRTKAVQKNLDDIFPGTHLTKITPERYNVHDNAHF
ncbi:hypothetical protein P8452_73320 [Trifolium repens]|nr:hypothetical protein QL285_090248 [Trifolium repens]WJX91562.1 hypothetical protein P8452_73320 [Trifolium repens]